MTFKFLLITTVHYCQTKTCFWCQEKGVKYYYCVHMCKYGCVCDDAVAGNWKVKRSQGASSIVKSLPRTYRHSSRAWIAYAVFMVFLTCLEMSMEAKVRKMLLFDVSDRH
jgi:hypothetical protein